MRRYVVSIDQGTTSSRVMLFDHSGRVVSVSQKEHPQILPQAALVEHDAEVIWSNVEACISSAMRDASAIAADIVSVGITNQRETIVVWNKETSKPYYNALVWQDQRGEALCERLAAASPLGRDRFKALTGLPLVSYFSASKLAWLLEQVPHLAEEARAGKAIAGTIDSFLLWKLTGGEVHATDVTNASRTLLYNIHTLKWDEELCATWGVPTQMLPTVHASVHKYGRCSAAAVPVLSGVPIGGILGDQQSALFGQTCFQPGEAKNTYGTGCFLLMNTGTHAAVSRHGLLTTIAYQLEGEGVVYALEGSVSVAGSLISWLRDKLGIIASASEVEALARSEADAGGLILVPAFNGLLAPHWRADARGTLLGISGNTTKGHIARAALEAVAFQTKDLLDAMTKDAFHMAVGGGGGGGGGGASSSGAVGAARASDAANTPLPTLRVDGMYDDDDDNQVEEEVKEHSAHLDQCGMTANELLMQFQSDLTGRCVEKPVVAETTALGAAYAAGLSEGFWTSVEQLKVNWQRANQWSPSMTREQALLRHKQWNSGITRSLSWTAVLAGGVEVSAVGESAVARASNSASSSSSSSTSAPATAASSSNTTSARALPRSTSSGRLPHFSDISPVEAFAVEPEEERAQSIFTFSPRVEALMEKGVLLTVGAISGIALLSLARRVFTRPYA